MATLTVAELRSILADMPQDAEVALACEHDGSPRFSHPLQSSAATTFGDEKVVVLYGSYRQLYELRKAQAEED